MAVRTEDRRIGRLHPQRTVEISGQVETGQGLQADVPDRIAVPRHRRGKPGIQWRPGRQRFQSRADHDLGSEFVRPRHPLCKRGEFGGSLLLVEAPELLAPPLDGKEQEKSPQENPEPEAPSTRRHSLSMMQQAMVHGKERDAWFVAIFFVKSSPTGHGPARPWEKQGCVGSGGFPTPALASCGPWP